MLKNIPELYNRAQVWFGGRGQRRFSQKPKFVLFLAAMSSSRSDVVTKFVRLYVRLSIFFLLVSLKFLLVLKSFNGVSRQFKECLKFNGSFKAAPRNC